VGSNTLFELDTRAQMSLDYTSAGNQASITGSASNAETFKISADGTASFTKVIATEYQMTSITLNETVVNRSLVDTLTTQRLGIAIQDDTAMENVPVARLEYINLDRESINDDSTLTTRVNALVNF
jgi:hypothetical protein